MLLTCCVLQESVTEVAAAAQLALQKQQAQMADG